MSKTLRVATSKVDGITLIPKKFMIASLMVLAVFVLTSWHINFSFFEISSGLEGVNELLQQMLPPSFDKFEPIINSVATTLGMAFFGTMAGFLLAIPAAFFVSPKTRTDKVSANLLSVFSVFTRSVPDIVFALIALTLLGLGPLPGAVAIAIGTSGSLTRLIANAINQNSSFSRNSLIALGAHQATSTIVSTLREVFPAFVSIAVYRLEINVKTSTILGLVGAGGVGSLLRTNLVQFDFQRAAATSLAIVATIVFLEIFSSVVRYIMLDQGRTRLKTKVFLKKLDTQKLRKFLSWFLFILTVAGAFLSIKYVLADFEFKARHLDIFKMVIQQLTNPDFGNSLWPLVGQMLETIEIAFMATAIGAIFGVPFALFAAWNLSPFRWMYFGARSIVTVIRGMPNVMFALIFVTGAGLGPVAGVMAMSVSAFGLCSKLVADSFEMAETGPRFAILATGATRVQEFFSATLPQVRGQLIANLLFALDINVRQATLLGMVGAGGIGLSLVEAARNFHFELVSTIVLLIIASVLAIDNLSKFLQQKLTTN